MMNSLSAAVSGLVVAAAFVIAQMHPYAGASADRLFVVTAEQTNNAEVAEGRLAERRGATSTVRMLGARMVRDHSLAERRLESIARSQGLPVTNSAGAENMQQMSSLQMLSGPAFDHAYIRANVIGHIKAISLVQNEAYHGRDAAVRRWASQTLPVLRMHLSLFQRAQRARV